MTRRPPAARCPARPIGARRLDAVEHRILPHHPRRWHHPGMQGDAAFCSLGRACSVTPFPCRQHGSPVPQCADSLSPELIRRRSRLKNVIRYFNQFALHDSDQNFKPREGDRDGVKGRSCTVFSWQPCPFWHDGCSITVKYLIAQRINPHGFTDPQTFPHLNIHFLWT